MLLLLLVMLLFCGLTGSLIGGGGLIGLGRWNWGRAAGGGAVFCTGAAAAGWEARSGGARAEGAGWLTFLKSKEGFGTVGLLITLP